MKNVVAVLTICCISFVSAPLWAQDKLTLEEAILQGRKFSPQSLPMLQWKADEDVFSYVKDGDLWTGKPGKTADLKFLSLADLNTSLKTEWKAFPPHQWLEQNVLAFEAEDLFLSEIGRFVAIGEKSGKCIC